MSDIKLINIKQENHSVKKLSTKGKAPVEAKQYVADKKEISKNIAAFDKKPRKPVAGPYDYNSIVLNKKPTYTPTADQMLTDPTYNTVGKFLGVDTHHDWGKSYDKVKDLVDWAKKKTGKKDANAIMNFLNGALNAAPSFGMHHKRIDQLHLYSKMSS